MDNRSRRANGGEHGAIVISHTGSRRREQLGVSEPDDAEKVADADGSEASDESL